MTRKIYTTILIVCFFLLFGCCKQPPASYSEQTTKKLQKAIMDIQNDNADLLSKIEKANNEKQILQEEIKKYSALFGQNINDTNLIGNTCTADKCLFVDNLGDPYGIATIEGYYKKVERTAWETTKECDDFVITGGSEEFKNFFINLVDQKNTVNSKDEQGQPVINLNIDELSGGDIEKIKDSNIDNPIKIIVLHPFVGGGMGAPVCYSFIEILKVK